MTQGEEGETDRKNHRQAERGWRAATVSREGRHRRGNLARRWKDENASSKESPVSPRHQEKAAERLSRAPIVVRRGGNFPHIKARAKDSVF